MIGASLSCWFSCSVTFSWLLPTLFFFLSIKSMIFPLLGKPSKWEWKQIIFWHLAFCTNQRFFPFEHLPEKKKHFTKEEIGSGEDKACNECGDAEGMWGHAPRTVMSVRIYICFCFFKLFLKKFKKFYFIILN